MTPEGLERLMRAIDNLYGVDYPPCANCGHAPKEHGRAAMQCQAYRTVEVLRTDLLATNQIRFMRYDEPCYCDCYDEPEESRLVHSKELRP